MLKLMLLCLGPSDCVNGELHAHNNIKPIILKIDVEREI